MNEPSAGIDSEISGVRYKLVHGYMWFLMGGLFLQGIGSLFFRTISALPANSPLLVRGTFGIDFWHSLIHITWGAIGLIVLSTNHSQRAPVWLALIFGTFYTALGIWGVVAHHPLGLELDLPENLFHLTAGPLALILGLINLPVITKGEKRAYKDQITVHGDSRL
jgi:hypothetical protein